MIKNYFHKPLHIKKDYKNIKHFKHEILLLYIHISLLILIYKSYKATTLIKCKKMSITFFKEWQSEK
jgi:hypothetical protein